jgi:ribosome hibernation promoting factor
MRTEFTARHTSLSPEFEDHATSRLAKLERLTNRLTGAHVVVSEERGRAGVEITLDLDGTPVRSEVKGPDPRVSFDAALEKLERRVQRYKARWHERVRKGRREPAAPAQEPEAEPQAEALAEVADEPEIRRTKSVRLKPMGPAEAALQMELLGHDFFLFRNAESDLVAVVYKREDGGYGLLECEA